MVGATARNRLEKQTRGSNTDKWGDPKINSVFDRIDELADGITGITVTAGTVVLSDDDFVANQSRNRILVVDGTLVEDVAIQVPERQKWYWVHNRTNGAFTLRIKTGAGNQPELKRDRATGVYVDGAHCHILGASALDQLDQPTGNLSMNGHRIVSLGSGLNPSDAATLGQITAAQGVQSPLLQLALWHLSA